MSLLRVRLRVPWVDTDTAGVVHFTNYFRYFERAEEELYNRLGFDYLSLREKYGIWVPRVEAHCKYKAPLRFNEEVEVRLWIEEVGEKHIKYGFSIENLSSGKTAAEGWVVIVAASIKENRAVPIPNEIREKLEEFKTG